MVPTLQAYKTVTLEGMMKALWIGLLGLTLTANARPPEGHEGHGRHRGPPPLSAMVDRHADDLGLTEQVAQEIRTIAEGQRAEMRSMHDDIRSAHDAMRTAMENADAEAAYAASSALGDAEDRMREHRLAVDLAVMTLLTADQRELLSTLRPTRERPEGRPSRR